MWKAYLAALLNFFLPGAGYLLAKARRTTAREVRGARDGREVIAAT